MSLLSLLLVISFSCIHSSPPTFDFSPADFENGFDEAIDLSHLKDEFFLYLKSFFDQTIDEQSDTFGTDGFNYILSIELRESKLYNTICERFKSCPRIQLFSGNSGEFLGDVISCANGRILFWAADNNMANHDIISRLSERVAEDELCNSIENIIMVNDIKHFQNSTINSINHPGLKSVMKKIAGINNPQKSCDILLAFSDNENEIFSILHEHWSLGFNKPPIFLGNIQGVSQRARDCFMKLPAIFGIDALHGMPWSMIFSS